MSENKAPTLNFRRPPYILHDEGTSWSGKWWIYLGHHYHTTAHECWVVGAINLVTGRAQEHHINTMKGPVTTINGEKTQVVNVCKDPKGEALIEWEEFKSKMQARPASEETDEANAEWDRYIKPFLQREAGRRGLGKSSSALQPGKDRGN